MPRWCRISAPARRNALGLTLACVAVLMAARTHAYATVWRSEVSLWRHAVSHAPLKPRPWINYGVALTRVGRYDEARQAWTIAVQMADGAHVPWWDAAVSRQLGRTNLAILKKMTP